MSPAIRTIAPRYVRLSGEIADQAILDSLRAVFPQASVGHAYASTEAGVAFDVNDGLAGFPAAFVGGVRDGVDMKVVDGSLQHPLAAHRVALCRRQRPAALADDDGFVDTGDMVELRGDRYYFVGRNGGIINIGGLKVHPEEVEAVINRHPQVRMSLVRPRQSPITGAIVVADVVLKSEAESARRATTSSSRTISSSSAARRCRATRCRPRSASCRRSRSPRPASWRAGKAEPWLRARATFSSPAAAAASGSPSRKGSPAPATASSPWRARRARR